MLPTSSSMKHRRAAWPQQGHAAVELALVLGLLVLLVTGTVDVARWSLARVSALEATRVGARVAALCDPGETAVGQRTLERLVGVARGGHLPRVDVVYEPAGCTSASCATVTVSLSGGWIRPIAPFMPAQLALPPSSTTLPREALRSQFHGADNPSCL